MIDASSSFELERRLTDTVAELSVATAARRAAETAAKLLEEELDEADAELERAERRAALLSGQLNTVKRAFEEELDKAHAETDRAVERARADAEARVAAEAIAAELRAQVEQARADARAVASSFEQEAAVREQAEATATRLRAEHAQLQARIEELESRLAGSDETAT